MARSLKLVDEHSPILETANVYRLIPVGLKEAALDSPSFRAAVVHYGSLIDQTEIWIDGYTKATARVLAETARLDSLLSGFLASASPPKLLSEAVVDCDHATLASDQHSEASKQWWSSFAGPLKKLDSNVTEPLRKFMQSDIKTVKDTIRQLEQSQKAFDSLHARYSAQGRAKEPSALREDAFHLHEARKLYLKASLDFACAIPQFKHSLDSLLIHTSGDQIDAIWNAGERSRSSLQKILTTTGRIRAWAQNISTGEKEHRRQLLQARRQTEESAESSARPSRDLDAYSVSAPSATSAGTLVTAPVSSNAVPLTNPEKQGWLNLKLPGGKPARAVWSRKWFYVRGGIFGWLVQGSKSGGVEESDRIGVLLCSVRFAPTEERRFCFEVRWKDGMIILQAESAQDRLNWTTTFENAKQNALADSSNTHPAGEPGNVKDLAFVISPPSAPEFAASAVDAGLGTDENNEKSSSHSGLSVDQSGMVHRGSFDVSGSRRSATLENDNGKEQAAKTAQRFDLHRKPALASTSAPNSTTATVPPTGGIATLVSSSNMALPYGNMSVPHAPSLDASGRLLSAQPQNRTKVLQALPTSTIAPCALANPPISTNLSWTATLVSGEKGADCGWFGDGAALPSVVNANVWGSVSHSQIQWLEQTASKQPLLFDETVDVSKRGGQQSAGPTAPRSQENLSGMPEHRKTVSADGRVADLHRAIVSSEKPRFRVPAILKHQDAQFRLLFPAVAVDERLAMVFRASWSFHAPLELPGRVYVTTEAIMFYSHHFGMVLTTGLALAHIRSVSVSITTGHDFLFLGLKTSGQGPSRRIAIKIFLEPPQLLCRRLSLLVQNANSAKPLGAEALLKEVARLETSFSNKEGTPSSEDDETNAVAGAPLIADGDESKDGLQARVLVDQGLDDPLEQPLGRENTRFKLPNRPVIYQPDSADWGSPVVESDFQISPKALFHVVFGDHDSIWHILYRHRHARDIRQGPWTREKGSRLYRVFDYCIDRETCWGKRQTLQVTDTQRIEVLSDHLCYVVSYRKTPWHLPQFQNLDMVTKVVITFEAKSRCKIAIYARTEWSPGSRPFLSAALIEEQALQDVKSDVSDVADLIAEQARRLRRDHESGTKRAIETFGSIGQQVKVIEHGNGSSLPLRALRFDMKQKTIARLHWDAFLSLFKYVLNLLLVALAFVVEWIWNVANANSVLLVLFVSSLLLNTLFSAQPLHVWLEGRHATALVSSMGVGDKLGLERAIQLQDIDTIARSPMSSNTQSLDGSCYRYFQQAAIRGNIITSLHHSRHRLQSYRHDLLVAMRIVNRIEYETYQAEFEKWLRMELVRCDSAEQALSVWQTGASTSSASRDARDRLREYCRMCREAGPV